MKNYIPIIFFGACSSSRVTPINTPVTPIHAHGHMKAPEPPPIPHYIGRWVFIDGQAFWQPDEVMQ